MRKINLFFGAVLFGLFSQTVFAAEITSITGGGGVLIDETNMTEETVQTLDNLVLTGDFGEGESLSLNFDSLGSDNLHFIFLPDPINFVTTDGDIVVSNMVWNSTSVLFDVSGSGTFELMDIKVLMLNPETEVFEKRTLRIEMDGSDYFGEEFVVDSFLYQPKEAFAGATGGDLNDIFKVADNLTYSFPTFDFDARGDFKIDFSVLGGVADFNIENTFEIIEGATDGTISFSVALEYDGFSFSKNFETGEISIDNILPSFDFENLLTLPPEKTVVGVGDEIIFTPPVDESGDTVFFSVDFSDIAGITADFDNELEAKTIVLEELNIEEFEYVKPVYFVDDAGNVPSEAINTELIGVDLILPIIQSSDLLSIVDGISPASYQSMIHFETPVDIGGNEITYSVDFSALGGEQTNFERVSELQDFSVAIGDLQDELFSVEFTIYDSAGNAATSTTNSILVDNKPPNFDLNCGASFTVVDNGDEDENESADFSFGEADTVIFLAPDKTLEGCSDLDSFSIDLSSISGEEEDDFQNQSSDGQTYSVSVGSGELDSRSQFFILRVFDALGNYSDFSSGFLDIDNQLISESDFEFSFSGLQNTAKTIDLDMMLSSVEDNDLVSLQAQILKIDKIVEFQETAGVWQGDLRIYINIFEELKNEDIVFSGIDDQGNEFSFVRVFDFVNLTDTTVIKGGGGGTSNLGNGKTINRKNVKRNFFNESSVKKEKAWSKLSDRERLFQKNLLEFKQKKKSPLLLPSLTQESIDKTGAIDLKKLWEPLTHYDKFQLKMRLSREAVFEKDLDKNKMEKTIKKIMLPSMRSKDWEKYEDRKGGFRVENSLAKLKKGLKKKTSKLSVSYRKTSLNKRGKYGVIKN